MFHKNNKILKIYNVSYELQIQHAKVVGPAQPINDCQLVRRCALYWPDNHEMTVMMMTIIKE